MGVFGSRILSTSLSVILIFAATTHSAAGFVQLPQPTRAATSSVSDYPGQGAPLTPTELQELVAPVALYPDALVAQILTGATFPDQVAIADNWLKTNPDIAGSVLMKEVEAQPWDPSVKALTQFTDVLDKMAQSLAWTSSLGEAYHNQQTAVMTAVQTLRAQAKAAGSLKSGSEITVLQKTPEIIVIQPTNPQIVYVPVYNPALVYGTAYVTPGYNTTGLVVTGLLSFGAGMAVGAIMSGGCCGWGYSSWNCNWYGGAAIYRGNAYYGNSAWHGGYYGTSAHANGTYGSASYGARYNPSTGIYAHGASTSTAYGSKGVGQAYNPNTGGYGATHQESNDYSSAGRSTYSKNGKTANTQRYSTPHGSVGTAESSNGDKYAIANGNAYKNTGDGWQRNTDGSWKSGSSASFSDTSHGWGPGTDSHNNSSSAFGGWGNRSSGFGSGGWGSRSASSRGWSSRGGGGGWARRR